MLRVSVASQTIVIILIVRGRLTFPDVERGRLTFLDVATSRLSFPDVTRGRLTCPDVESECFITIVIILIIVNTFFHLGVLFVDRPVQLLLGRGTVLGDGVLATCVEMHALRSQ